MSHRGHLSPMSISIFNYFNFKERSCSNIQLVHDSKEDETRVIRNAQAVIDIECELPTLKPVECSVDKEKGFILLVKQHLTFQYKQ